MEMTTKRSGSLLAALAVTLSLGAGALTAGTARASDTGKEVSVSGDLQCAKCNMKAKDATKCQDVLVVAGKDGSAPAEYYLVKNDVAEKFGHVCRGTKSVAATGTVLEKDGKKWLTATKIEQSKS